MSPARSTTRPFRQSTDASPGLLCSPMTRCAASATTVCRSRAPDLPYTVTELRPLSAAAAAASWLSASAVIDATSMDVDGGTTRDFAPERRRVGVVRDDVAEPR